MALTFSGATSDKVDCGSGSSLDNLTTATYLAWGYRTGAGDSDYCRKGLFASGYRALSIVSGTLQCEVARSTDGLEVGATGSNFTVDPTTTNKWVFAAGVHDTGGTDGDQKLYTGDLVTAAAEPSAYGTQTIGSGTVGNNSSQNQIIGNKSNDGNNFDGAIAIIAIYNRVLTLNEIISWQFFPRKTSGCVLFMHLGHNGTGTQPDLSGNGNNGTVTGSAQSDHVPLRPFYTNNIIPFPTAVTGTGAKNPFYPRNPLVGCVG